MPIKRYHATKDNSITNAYKMDFKTRATSSNMGLADVLEVFSIYGQVGTSSVETMRAIVQFNTDDIVTDRNNDELPDSGSVNFFLRMYNASHAYSLPRNYKMQVFALSQSWSEGSGLDLEEFSDEGQSNWVSANSTTAWETQGGHTHSAPVYEFSFGETGAEDLLVDVTGLVEQWISGTKDNNGFLIKLSGNLDTSPSRSYYTKKFFSRSSEFFFKRPVIEARHEDHIFDDRGNFYYSSSLQTADENLNTLYLYNYYKDKLRNIPGVGTGRIYLSAFSGNAGDTSPGGDAINLVADGTHVTSNSPTVVTGGFVSTGVYSASFAATAAATVVETLYDVWHNGDLSTQYWTGSFEPKVLDLSTVNNSLVHVTTMTNLKEVYYRNQKHRFRVYTRPRNWSPNIYTKAVASAEPYIVASGSYRVYRIIDDLEVVEYGTGSLKHTGLSFDVSGNYFDFDFGLLESGYSYAFKVSYYNAAIDSYEEQPEIFSFRVEDFQQ